jgi:nitrate reductase (NAD(P)H)
VAGVVSYPCHYYLPSNFLSFVLHTGITPILQVIRAVLYDDADKESRVWLIDTNKTEHDILCREELDTLYQLYKSDRFVLHHTVTVGKAPQLWKYSTGRISDQMLAAYLPPASEHSLILTCGPERLIQSTVKPGLQRLGWDITKDMVVF